MVTRGLLTVRRMMVVALLAAGASCATGSGTGDDPEFPEDSGAVADTGKQPDGGGAPDVGEPADVGGTEDAGGPEDAGLPDTGARDVHTVDVGFDGGGRDVPVVDVSVDSGGRDVPAVDVGFDVGFDVGTPDTGPRDTGAVDTGTPDTGPRDTGTPDVPTCVPATEVANGRDDDCDGLVDEGFSGNVPPLSLACTGSGRTILFGDADVDDGGSSSRNDGLEVFCINGSARFCLTGEACPWRAGTPAVDDGRSCSSAGLDPRNPRGAYFMAYLTRTYLNVGGYQLDLFYCPPSGRIVLNLN